MKALRALRTLATISASKPTHFDLSSTLLCRVYAAQPQQDTTTSATTSSSSEDVESGDSVFNSRHYELPNMGSGAEAVQRPTWDVKALLEASMEEDQMYFSVGNVGAPNAEKSALTNYMVGTKVAAVSRKTNLTRHDVLGVMTKGNTRLSHSSIPWENPFTRGLRRHYHDGRPRGSLWRGKKLIGKEALFVILGLKRVKDDEDNLNKFIKTHVSRLLKMDMIAVLVELERQEQVALALKIFMVIQKEDWYKPDVFLYKDLIVALAKSGKMDDVMKLWESMKKENLFPDSQTYTEVIRGFLRCGSPADAMNVYEDMKKSPDPPEELPFRILLKGLLPHPLLRNKVKQEFEEIFPDSHMYDPPEEIFGLR